MIVLTFYLFSIVHYTVLICELTTVHQIKHNNGSADESVLTISRYQHQMMIVTLMQNQNVLIACQSMFSHFRQMKTNLMSSLECIFYDHQHPAHTSNISIGQNTNLYISHLFFIKIMIYNWSDQSLIYDHRSKKICMKGKADSRASELLLILLSCYWHRKDRKGTYYWESQRGTRTQ